MNHENMNINHQNKLRNDILSRVHTVHGVRAFLISPIANLLFLVILIFSLSICVSFGDVLANTWHHVDWSERFSYAFSSLIHSSILVQALAVLVIFACLSAIRNSLRKIRMSFGSARLIP
ncbi:MAG TPA: hypothetical protein VJJ28_03380 [Candidatus Paceibacterota bacterium]